jgi:hypothetical protein
MLQLARQLKLAFLRVALGVLLGILISDGPALAQSCIGWCRPSGSCILSDCGTTEYWVGQVYDPGCGWCDLNMCLIYNWNLFDEEHECSVLCESYYYYFFCDGEHV